MKEEEMDKQIAKIIKEALADMSHSNCNLSESTCNKDSPDYEPKHIHCGTDRCKGLHQNE
ncbi:MAG: hypothetical protein ACFE9S_13380 [Candidatus Hermodarchaeota archaeon]